MKKIFLIAFAFLFFGALQAQQHYCGTTIESQQIGLDRLVQNRINANHNGSAGQREADYYVPVKFHLVGKNDGSQFITESAVLDMLCTLNSEYADMTFSFISKCLLITSRMMHCTIMQVVTEVFFKFSRIK